MKRLSILTIILSFSVLFNLYADDNKKKLSLAKEQAPMVADTETHIGQIKTLEAKEQILQKKLDAEMQKRNATFSETRADVIEDLNDRQDSVCLDLKSQIVDIQLQIRDIKNQQVSSFMQAIPAKKAE